MIKASIEFEISKADYTRFKSSGGRFESKANFIDRNRDLIMELTPDRFKDIQIIDFDVGIGELDFRKVFYIVIEGEF